MDVLYISDKPYAGLLRRCGAYLVDGLVLLGALVVLHTMLYMVNPLMTMVGAGQQPTAVQIHLWVFLTASLPCWFYFALTISSTKQATLGMRLLNLQVSDVAGKRISFGRALLRAVVMLIPFELNHVVMFHLAPKGSAPSPAFYIGLTGFWIVVAIYVACAYLTRHRQSVHDLIAGTVLRRLS